MSGAPGQELVRFDRVALTFPGGSGRSPVEVIRELNLDVQASEFVAIIGPSGCGKSTLLLLLAGYLAPSSGQVRFRGKPISGPGRERMMVFQQPALFPWLTTAENVAYGLKLKANRRDAAACPARGLCASLSERSVGRYATASRNRPRACRRPAGSADGRASGGARCLDPPNDAARSATHLGEARKTILFVTHDIDEAVVMADRVVVMAQRPTFVLEIEEVRLPRPRLREDPEVGKLARRLSTLLE